MLGEQSPQMDLADAVLWTGKANPKPLVEKGSFHDRFAEVRPTILRDKSTNSRRAWSRRPTHVVRSGLASRASTSGGLRKETMALSKRLAGMASTR